MKKSLFILGTILLTTIAVQTGIETYASNNSFNQEQIESKASKPKTQYSELEFDTHEEAKDNIQVIPEKSGIPVDLGNNITGYQEGGAGSRFITFHIKNYGVFIRTNSILGQDNVALSKEVAQILLSIEKYPETDRGLIRADFASGMMSITWASDTFIKSVTSSDLRVSIEKALTK
ncbi:TPA: hypothetical protein IUU19_002710 [Enterococcus faecalis]|nr:hypothetical protein [Enterococcus faecalis]EGO8259124.1 hypothetical protein [Enterococcus faecalis]EIP8072284.1 hypothetical protein [Enterococcus faecalis]HAP3926414.1 hypothetical protein [Enterococcus faecalis]